MEVWSANKLLETITKLKDKGRIGDEQCVMYVLNPLITSLGYDVFNIDEVDTDMMLGKMGVRVQDGLKILVGLSVNFPRYDSEDEKIYLHVDIHELKLTLYMKALGNWESVGEVYLNQQDEQRMYPYIMKNIAKSTLKQVYAEKGERLFTEGVLKNNLEEGELDNRFVKSVLREELNNPSDSFIKLIAEGLVKRYSTENVSGLVSKLMPLKDIGLTNVVKDVLNYDVIEEVEDTLTPVKKEFTPEESKDSLIPSKQVEEDAFALLRENKKEEVEEEKGAGEVFLEKGQQDVTYKEVKTDTKDTGIFIEKTERVEEEVKISVPENKPRVRQINPLKDKMSRESAEDKKEEKVGELPGEGTDLMSLLNGE